MYVVHVKNTEYRHWNFGNDIFNLILNKGVLTTDKGKTDKGCECCQLQVINISIFSSGGTKKIGFTENVVIPTLVKDQTVKELCFYDVDLHENRNGPVTFCKNFQ